jgi:hypothetical protein
VASVSGISKEQLLYDQVEDLTSANQLSNAVSSNASPRLMVRFLGGERRSFLKDGVKTYQLAPMSPPNSPTFFIVGISIVNGFLSLTAG